MYKRIIVIVLSIVLSMTLIACKPTVDEQTEWVVLPDLNGLVETEIITRLDELNVNHIIEYHETQIREYEHQFIMYSGREIGDVVSVADEVIVIVYPTFIPDTLITLPSLGGFSESDVIAYMTQNDIVYYIVYVDTEDTELDALFAGYTGSYEPGDSFDNFSALGVQIYRYTPVFTDEYFQVIELPYDGPILDLSLIGTEYLDPRGGAFEVTILNCTDGDTARFNYPQDIYDAITSGAKSARFLNMDTEETYFGGEEEWGKPASLYTCSLLNAAESIVLQTDPNDGLLGTYGRLLSWVWIQLPGETDYQLLNYMVVRQGLAQVKFEYGAGETLMSGDYTLNEWMHIAEDAAIDDQYGQWGNRLDYYWNYDEDQPYYDRWNSAS